MDAPPTTTTDAPAATGAASGTRSTDPRDLLAASFPMIDVDAALAAAAAGAGAGGMAAGSPDGGEPTVSWPELRPAVVQRLLAVRGERLGGLLPSLGALADRPIDLPRFRLRTRRALGRLGLRTWGDLAGCTVETICLVQGAGDLTVADLVGGCADVVWERRSTWESLAATTAATAAATNRTDRPRTPGTPGTPGTPSAASKASTPSRTDRPSQPNSTGRTVGFEVPVRAVRLLGALGSVEQWLAAERPGRDLAAFLESADRLGAPDELRRAIGDAARQADLGTAPLPSIDEALAAVLDRLGARGRLVFERREVADPPPTLESVARDLGLTRERIRQLQVQANQRVAEGLASTEAQLVRWRAADLARVLGPMAPATHPEVVAAWDRATRGVRAADVGVAREFLRRLAGGHERNDHGWWVRPGTSFPEPVVLASVGDEHGLIDDDAAAQALDRAGIDTRFREAWFETFPRAFRRVEGTLCRWDGDIAARSIAVLAVRGAPATAPDLVAALGEGHSVRTAHNAFGSDDRLVRVSPKLWALRTWGFEEHASIAEQITRRLREADGVPVSLDRVIRDLVETHQLRASSVRAYLGAPAFVVSDGKVRLRTDDDPPFPVSTDVSRLRWTFRPSDDVLVTSIPVERERLRGSGRPIARALGGALGLRPGEPRSFRSGSVTVRGTWPMTSFLGPALGSVRALAERVHAVDGDRLALHVDLRSGGFTAHRVPAHWPGSISPSEALLRLTGLSPGPTLLADLAAASGSTPTRVATHLTDRGDGAIYDLAASLAAPAT